ncbi:MAG: dockerin type I domain-containing protein [Caldilineaceae bacterium]
MGQAAPSSTTGGIFNHEDFISAEYAGLVMNYNNLHGNNGYEFYHDVPQASGTKDARFNWWRTTDTNRINNEIYDFIDDSSLAIVDYSGFLDTPSTDAPPAPPTGLAVALVGETFNLTWDANQEADIAGYKVFYDLDSGYPWEGKGATQGDAGIDVGNNLSFALSGLPANRDIYFTALAYDNTGEESWYAQEVVKRLPAPINLTAAPSSVNVRLDWNATNDASVTHYRITRIISGTTNFQGLAANHTDTTYFDQDTALIAGADYCYKVEALNGRDDVIITSNLACATFGKLGLYAPNSVGKSGATVIVPINIRNADGLRIGASDIWLDFNPAVVEFQSVERTPLTIDYAWAHAVESINANTNRVRISYIHNVPNQDPPELYGNGSLFWVKFQTKGADGATSPLDMQEFVKNVGGSAIQNENLTDLALEVLDGLFTVKGATNAAFILGDVDGDGVVRALDAALALRLAAGLRTPTPEELQAGDINGNGVIQAADASMILYFAGNGSWPPLPGAPLTAAAMHAQTTLFLDDVVGKAGAAVQTTLRGRGLSNVAGADFVIVYDTELVIGITQVAKAGLAATFDKVEFQDDGTGRVFISMADDVAIDSDGILLTLDVQIANGANIGDKAPLLLAEAQLNDLNGRDFVTSFADNTLIRQSGEVIISSIQANPANFDFIAITNGGDPAPQMLAIEADASISWSITANQNWIEFSQTSGSGPADVSVYVHIADLSAGTYSGEIAITAGAQTMIRQVQLVVDPENALPILQSSPASLVFSALQNGAQPASQVININNGGTGTLGWTAAATQSWINLSATSGTAPSTITISIDSRGLAVGEHTGEIQIAAGTQTVTVNIRLTIAVGGDVGRDNVVYLPLILLPLIMR